jgi:membrane protein
MAAIKPIVAKAKSRLSSPSAPPPSPKAAWLDLRLQRLVAPLKGRKVAVDKPSAKGLFNSSTSKAQTSSAPRASAKSGTPSKKSSPARHGRIEALGWFLLAGVILVWPRARPLIDTSKLSPNALLGRFQSGLSKGGVATASSVDAEILVAEALEPGHGRAARDPFQIPLRGWQDIFWRTLREFGADNITQVAGGVAFFGLLSIFPAMGAFVSLYGLFSNVTMAESQLNVLSGVLPDAALQMVGQQMLRLAQARHSGLGLAFAISLLVSLWSANAGVKALFSGLNIAFEETEKRNFLKLNLASLGFTVGALLFLTLAFTAIVAVPIALAYLGYTPNGFAVMTFLRWPLLLFVAIGGITVLYRYGPSRERERWRWVSWGSVFAAVLWLAASLLFSIYVAHFGSYDRTYGSLGAVVGFMSWLWISSIAILFGAELNSEIEHQTAFDTTTGAPAPMGQRGAHMADTLGEIRTPKLKAKPVKPTVLPASPQAHSASTGSPPRP